MTDLHSPIEELNEQLQELLNEWTSEISLVLRELSDKRARVSELQAGFDKRGEKVAALEQRIRTQQVELDSSSSTSAEEVDGLNTQILSLREQVASNQTEIEDHRTRATTNRDEIDQLRGEITALEKQVSAQNELIEQNESHARQNSELNERIAELETRIAAQQELIDNAEGEAQQVASLKAELSTLQTEAASLRRDSATKDEELQQLQQRIESSRGENESASAEVEKLRSELNTVTSELSAVRAEFESTQKEAANLHSETTVLHSESSEKEKTIERIRSELESKQELIQALRRETESARTDLRNRNAESDRLKNELGKAEIITGELRAELQLMLDAEKEGVADHSAELQALRAELEARKAVIKSLRADAERFDALEARLDEKRRVNAKLEESLSYHATTIADLKRSAENWRRKYQDLRLDASGEYKVEPTFTETDIRAIENMQKKGGSLPEHTIAIDMRESLAEARRSAGGRSDGNKG